jgi:hypothetical protein
MLVTGIRTAEAKVVGEKAMDTNLKYLTDFLVGLGVERIGHTNKTYLGHLVGVYRLMQTGACDEELCRAGMFHSIYGTQQFQGFTLPLERRGEVRALIGERGERLAYLNCAMDRASFDRALEDHTEPYRIADRLTGQGIEISWQDFDDLCAVHLYDWLEQVPRSRLSWGYRRAAYRRMAERLGDAARGTYDRIFAQEPLGGSTGRV